ncbi:uncharacterized protein (TIGR02678 family) [Streptomyces sp. 1114.5]|uniref:DUF2398 family protein n=1 Tax=Streptomyces sp. 1114.5 TaxID=1938830 RepID=UPI000EAC631D|nr:DUF2398 family protein [Streptomyces sp. 1114.5]RKT11762.1 uncharacterized protein (TIGR02678 family) [Streptomyces sp. 1114.5]
MDQQDYAVGATRVAVGRLDGRAGGAGRGAAHPFLAVREAVGAAAADDPQAAAPGGVPGAAAALSPDPGLLRLAQWFAAATPGTAHDLCAASFGLYPARHFGAPAVPADPDVSWWHGPTAHAAASPRSLAARTEGGLRRARRDAAALPVVRSGAKPGRPGRHRKPEISGMLPETMGGPEAPETPAAPRVASPSAAPVAQDRSGEELPAAERRIAARLLLAHPLVTASGPHADGFPLIRRHRDWLAERFDTLLGYRLDVGPWHARLCKAGLGPGAARRLEHPATGAPFTPGGYARLALALAFLVDAPEQLGYRQLLDAMRAAAPEPAASVDPADSADSADLDMALAALAGWQVLGDLPSDADDDTFVLTVDRELARAVPVGPPALAADAADLIRLAAEAEPATAVRRLLAETPAVLAADLPEERRAWLYEHRLSGPAALAEFLGLEAELRAEGVALLDPAAELTDLALPGVGTLAQAGLLLVERLVEEVRPLPGEISEGDVPIPDALIDGVLGDIADEYGLPARYLSDRTALRRDALDFLLRLGLITPTPQPKRPPTWHLRPHAARFAPTPDLQPVPGTGRHSRREPLLPPPPSPRTELRA